ncbi:MAG: hypothetical protein EGR33_04675, partial [Prevotella sp.]|nr:hypothetical protein [Prevotella sp.]
MRPQIVLLAATSNATIGREQRYLRPRIDNLPSFLAITKISFKIIVCTVGVLQRLITRVRDNILKSKEQKNIQPTKGGHKMVTCQNYVS